MVHLPIILSLFCLLGAALAVALFCAFRMRVRREMAVQLSRYRAQLREYQERMSLIVPHASDYMTSLRPDTTRALLDLQRLIGAQKEIAEYLEAILKMDDFTRFGEAQDILNKVTPRFNAQTREAGLYSRSNDYWGNKAESLLQNIGQDIYRATLRATQVGLPRTNRDHQTVSHLSRAGIVVSRKH